MKSKKGMGKGRWVGPGYPMSVLDRKFEKFKEHLLETGVVVPESFEQISDDMVNKPRSFYDKNTGRFCLVDLGNDALNKAWTDFINEPQAIKQIK